MTHSTITLITGGNRGIGKEAARQLVAKGHTVILTSRSVEKGEAAAAEIGNGPGEIVPIQLDVTDSASIRRASETVKERFGRLDVLVNNAGIDYDRDQRAISADLDRAAVL